MIVLALVAQESRVIASSYDPDYAQFLDAAEAILQKIQPENAERLSYAYESWLFHYIAHDQLVYLAVADADQGRRIPFAFLSEVEKECSAKSTPTPSAAFQPKLDALRAQFNQAPESDPIRRAQAELGSVKDVITQNVEQILSRGEQIELLVDRTDSAAHQSLAFRRRAVGLRRQMWWRNTRVMLIAGICTVLLLYFIISSLS
ncbi:hypothetical protein MYAM1_003804 [Malassezia yamatoensis]|uniref:Synaptobrevin homolog YKT6 n=1 Tax=Malassezia yamatoensis TaxID=253288 RepID=A0AAJ5YUZ1_9BASI|nr:hypothetical protein MYAM1_003804 [Malassezia yamatoensis]